MQVFPKLLLVAALLALAGNGTLRADGIVQSSEPFLLTGDGLHSWDDYEGFGRYQMWATGTNGTDTLRFQIVNVVPFGINGMEFETTSGTIFQEASGRMFGTLWINGAKIHQFEYYLGNQNGYIKVLDDDYQTISAIGYFHQTSLSVEPSRGGPNGPTAYSAYGTFRILPYAPVPEPDMSVASALILAGLGIYGFRRKSAPQ